MNKSYMMVFSKLFYFRKNITNIFIYGKEKNSKAKIENKKLMDHHFSSFFHFKTTFYLIEQNTNFTKSSGKKKMSTLLLPDTPFSAREDVKQLHAAFKGNTFILFDKFE